MGNKNKLASLCQGSAITVGLILSIAVLFIAYESATVSYGFQTEFRFDIFVIVFVIYEVSIFLGMLVLYALGEIIELLTTLLRNTNMSGTYSQHGRPSNNVSNGKADLLGESSPVVQQSSDVWICKKCNTRNEGLSRYCKDCGEYK